MRKTAAIFAAVAGCLLTGGALQAQTPSVAQMLEIRPKLEDVDITIPTAEELKGCEVKDVSDGGRKIGYELLDVRKQTVRRYVMGKGAPRINTWSFYKDGVEVFRQISTDSDNKVDQYRWLGTGGLKWGISTTKSGRIDSWQMISSEEVAHELFLALANNDFARLKALYITTAEIQQLGLPAAQAQKIMQAQQAAPQKFQQALANQPTLAKAKFVRVESAAPGCWLAEEQGTPNDIIKFASRSILFETADKKHDWFQTGEIIQVGKTWRLLDVSIEAAPAVAQNLQLNKLLGDLTQVDGRIAATPNPNPAQANPTLAALYEERAALCEQIAAASEAKEKETWYKQILDSLSSAVIAGSDKSKARLSQYCDSLTTKMPGSNLAGYAEYRRLWSEYTSGPVTPKGQEAYQEKLAKFVKDYPQADDTPDVLHQLGMGCEFAGTKEKEEEAAKWYRAIYTSFPQHTLAEWAKGAERRLNLVGNPLQLSGTLLNNTPYDINQSKGKTVVVYYWESHGKDCAVDFARLKQVLSKQTNVDLVCVNLDQKLAEATNFLQQNANLTSAFHIAQAIRDQGGLHGALATYYGINFVPTVFVVGRDGRVINTKLQVADLEEALKKAQ